MSDAKDENNIEHKIHTCILRPIIGVWLHSCYVIQTHMLSWTCVSVKTCSVLLKDRKGEYVTQEAMRI